MSSGALVFCVAVSLAAAEAAEPGPASSEQQATASAISALRAVHRAKPNDPKAAMDLGLLLYRQDSASLEAQRLLDKASIMFPKRHDVHLALLDSYLTRGNLTAATSLLRRLRPELDASDRLALDAIYCLLRHGRLPLASEHWQRTAERARRQLPATPAPALEPATGRPAQCALAEVLLSPFGTCHGSSRSSPTTSRPSTSSRSPIRGSETPRSPSSIWTSTTV